MKNELKTFTDEQLRAELDRRTNLQRQKQQEKYKKDKAEEDRIYNLPENVEERNKADYNQALQNAIQHNALYKLGEVNEKTKGVWAIYGEDPNCDMGGPHHSPYLCSVEGTLAKAVKYAINLQNFYTWGGGGSIKLSKKEEIVKL